MEIESPYEIPQVEKSPIIGARKKIKLNKTTLKAAGNVGLFLATGGVSALAKTIFGKKKNKKTAELFPKPKLSKKIKTAKSITDAAEEVSIKGRASRVDSINEIQENLGLDISPSNIAE